MDEIALRVHKGLVTALYVLLGMKQLKPTVHSQMLGSA